MRASNKAAGRTPRWLLLGAVAAAGAGGGCSGNFDEEMRNRLPGGPGSAYPTLQDPIPIVNEEPGEAPEEPVDCLAHPLDPAC